MKKKTGTKKPTSEIIIPIEETVANIKESTVEWTNDMEGQILKISKTTLERYEFPINDIDQILSLFSKKLFDLDHLQLTILGIIGEGGSVNEDFIARKAFEINADYTRDKVRYRLNHSKSPQILLKLNFISKEKGKKIGNLSKTENIYRLTFKGLLASLVINKFEKNHMVKKFKDVISGWINTYNIPEFSLQFIKYHLALFMLKHVTEGSKLTSLTNIESMFSTLNQGDSLIMASFSQKTKSTAEYEIAIDVRSWFHVYSQVISTALKKVIHDSNLKKKEIPLAKDKSIKKIIFPSEHNYAVGVVPEYLKNWYYYIEKLQYKNINKYDPHSTIEIHSDNQKDLRIDHYATNILAKRILKKHGIHPNFSLIESSEFIF